MTANNICAIQARMGSSRLPGKSLFKLGNETVIERCYKSATYHNIFSNVVVLTSKDSADDELSNYLEVKKIPYHRGSLNNVLSRFVDIVNKTKATNIMRLTGDNPLIDPNIIRDVLQQHLKNEAEYTSNIIDRNLPRGNDVECIKSELLIKINKKNLTDDEREHVTLYIRKNLEDYYCFEFKSKLKIRFPNVRLTLDYYEDYVLIREIYKKLNLSNEVNNIISIDNFLSQNAKLLKINSQVEQTKINKKTW